MQSEHFDEESLACPCCGECRVHELLLTSLEDLRVLHDDEPLHVTSAYRCEAHNFEIPNSSPSSTHLSGLAADIWSEEQSPVGLALLAEQIEAFRHGGIGLYEWGVHVDVRNRRSRWGEIKGRRMRFHDAVRLIQELERKL